MRKIALSMALFLVSLPAWACWQVEGDSIKLQNSAITARFTFDRRPLASATVHLMNRKDGKLKAAVTDQTGSVTFKTLPGGDYQLTLLGPSNESFNVSLLPGFPEKTRLAIDFYGDWCNKVLIVPDR